MERKIGETFEYEGEKLKVVNAGTACDGCYFKGKSCDNRNYDITGICGWTRKDNQPVIFIKVTEEQQAEQPQEGTKEPKERKVGEVFEYQGKKFKVVETKDSTCYNCYFANRDCDCENTRKVLGACVRGTRTDNKPVIFVEVKKETKEHQEERPQKLNLCEILKDCPRGEMFWSPVFGNVWFCVIDQYTKRVKVRTSGVASWYINADGTITIDKVTSPEIMLYPSKEQRDWSKFTAPWLKKEKFDPKTLQPFDKVLVRDGRKCTWFCKFFSHIMDSPEFREYATTGGFYRYCIPYNDDTKHLVGTTEEAPEFYKYWED